MFAAPGEGQDAFSQAAERADCPGLPKAATGKSVPCVPSLPGKVGVGSLFRDVLIAPGKPSVNPTDTVLSLAC